MELRALEEESRDRTVSAVTHALTSIDAIKNTRVDVLRSDTQGEPTEVPVDAVYGTLDELLVSVTGSNWEKTKEALKEQELADREYEVSDDGRSLLQSSGSSEGAEEAFSDALDVV